MEVIPIFDKVFGKTADTKYELIDPDQRNVAGLREEWKNVLTTN